MIVEEQIIEVYNFGYLLLGSVCCLVPVIVVIVIAVVATTKRK